MRKSRWLVCAAAAVVFWNIATAEELLVTYSASTMNPVAGEPVSFSGNFEFNTLDGTVGNISYYNGYLMDWTFSAPGSGTITENFANGSTVTLTAAGTFNAHGGSATGGCCPVIRNFGPPSVGLFAPDGYVDYTLPTEAQYLASPDPWAQILLSTYVDADEGYFFDNVYFQDNTGKLEVSAVPLPAAAWLLMSGLGGLGILARKRLTVSA